MPSHFERMLQMADEIFSSRTDKNQLDVNPQVLEHLKAIHPATVTGKEDSNGPIAWILVIPTTHELMNLFLDEQISERDLYERTPLHGKYEAVYLCSAMVLEEYRHQGLALSLTKDAINSIRKDHNIKALFVWPFSDGGTRTAERVAEDLSLPLFFRSAKH